MIIKKNNTHTHTHKRKEKIEIIASNQANPDKFFFRTLDAHLSFFVCLFVSNFQNWINFNPHFCFVEILIILIIIIINHTPPPSSNQSIESKSKSNQTIPSNNWNRWWNLLYNSCMVCMYTHAEFTCTEYMFTSLK